VESATQSPSITFETSPEQYRHWKLSFDGPVATLAMDVREDAGLRPNDYKLKLNSYDLGVDIELADALQRLRFEHPGHLAHACVQVHRRLLRLAFPTVIPICRVFGWEVAVSPQEI